MATTPKTPVKTAQKAPTAAARPAPATQVAVRTVQALALPADLEAELAAEAKDVAAAERPSVSRISIKSGILSYNGQPMPGNKMEVVVLAAAYRNAWYSTRYNPNDIKNPNCFAFSADGEDMTPHENVSEPVNDTCKGCPKNEWGSAADADNPNSRGKACKETRRLMLIAANDFEAEDVEDPVEGINKAEAAVMDLPVTSTKNYANFANVLNATVKRPPYAVVTEILVRPHAKNQMEVVFTPLRMIKDADVILALRARTADAMRVALTPYDESYKPGEEAPPTPSTPARKKKF